MNSENDSGSSGSEYDASREMSNLSLSETSSDENCYFLAGASSSAREFKTSATGQRQNSKKALETNITNENLTQRKHVYVTKINKIQDTMQDVNPSNLSDKERDGSAINPTGNNSNNFGPRVVKVYPSANGTPLVVQNPGSSYSQPTQAPEEQPGTSLFARLPQYLMQLFSSIPQVMPFYGGNTPDQSPPEQSRRDRRSIARGAIHKLHKHPETCSADSAEHHDPKYLKVSMKPHQSQAQASSALQKQQHAPRVILADPHEMPLYDKRMTDEMLREFGSITTEVIDRLHKQLETCPAENTELPDPKGLKVSLKPHQRHALAWLAWREQQLPPVGILADDMGLGKTLTMISHILRLKVATERLGKKEWLSRKIQIEKMAEAVQKSRATLIIVPASIIHQWAKEIERRVKPGLLKFIVYHGPKREKNIHKLIDNDIVLTTYNIISKEVGSNNKKSADSPDTDPEKEQTAEVHKTDPAVLPTLLRIGWERIVLDEAHNIKNHNTLVARAVYQLWSISKWALTGTPIQNNLMDLYALIRFLRFSPFDQYQVWARYVGSEKGDLKRLNTIVKALLLRRTKHQISLDGKPLLSLPSRSTETVQVVLNTEERAVYEKLFLKTQSTVRAYLMFHKNKESLQRKKRNSNADASQTVGSLSRADSASNIATYSSEVIDGLHQIQGQGGQATCFQILVLLLRLRQCCSHLSLLKSRLEAEALESEGIQLSLCAQLKDMDIEEIVGDSSSKSAQKLAALFDQSAQSSKLKKLLEKIKSIKSEGTQKCVVVSQWTQMLEVVGHHLEKAGINCISIQGNIPVSKRMDIVDEFNTNSYGAKVLLLSLKAGGVGLNLIGGNHLFLLDNHWNPALDEQACDRIYRMGQKKDVFIYKFLCNDTIEEKIVALQEKKLQLAKSVLSGAERSSQKLTLSDLRSLFGV